MQILKAGVHRTANRGLTLIELSMVLLVLGIIMTLVAPRLGGVLDRQEMRRTINVIRGTARYLQARAAVTKNIYRLTFDFERQIMSVCPVDPQSGACQAEAGLEGREFAFPAGIRLLDMVSYSGEKITDGLAATHFHPTGVAEPSVFHLRGDDQRHITLAIQPLAGGVKVFEGYVEAKAL
jgi:prepilin-type N-terminal cleavage/methylation domain-containing protein